MTKYHIRDDYGRAACNTGHRGLMIAINDWVRRIASDQCQACAKRAAGKIQQEIADQRAAARQEG